MMKQTFRFCAAMAVMAVSLAFFSCQKDNITPVDPTDTVIPEEPDARDPYLGTYDATYTYDSIAVDNVWFENGNSGMNYDPDYGFIVITADSADQNAVNLKGYVIYDNDNGGQDTHLFYNTTAVFDSLQRLVPAPSVFTLQGLPMSVVYGPLVVDGDFLTYKMEEHLPYGNMDFGYIYTVTGTRR